MGSLAATDPEIARAIEHERQRQRYKIELIAAENYASAAVLEAQGSILTNKYAEGYPGRRYYGGCDNVDIVESLAIERAKVLFSADHANVQPHSGTQANLAAYFALLDSGDKVMAMDLAHGGHLSHGSPANISGRLYQFVHYGVDRETERLDYDALAKMAQEHQPKLIVAGASAYPRIIDFERFQEIADAVGALLMVDMAHIAGLVAVGLHPSPVPHAQVVTSTTHKTMRGPRAGFILCQHEWAARIDRAIFPGTQAGPLMHVVAAKAVAFLEAMQPQFALYQRAVVENARLMAQELAGAGLRIVSGGTDNHLLLVDLNSTGLTGKEAEEALDAVGITANKNAIPFDTKPPAITSGIRFGTPAVTSRGFGSAEIQQVAQLIVRILQEPHNEAVRHRVREEVRSLTERFPVPGITDDNQ